MTGLTKTFIQSCKSAIWIKKKWNITSSHVFLINCVSEGRSLKSSNFCLVIYPLLIVMDMKESSEINV